MEIIIWFVVWYSTWIFFNIFVRWRLEKYKSNKFFYRSFYFLLISVGVYLLGIENTRKFLPSLIFGFFLSFVLGYILSKLKKYYYRFKKDKYFIEYQSFNVTFQQLMVVLGYELLLQKYGNNYQHYYLGIFFMLAHVLILLAKWSTYRYFVLPITFVGGVAFSYILKNFDYGLTINILIHQLIYVFWLFEVKDEEKI